MSLSPPIVPDVVFDGITDMTSCTTGMISWSTVGDPTDLTLYVTNDLNDGSVTPPSIFNITLGTNVIPSLHKFVWSPVNVPHGQYQILGLFNDLYSTSPSFFVANGTDLSCLPSTPVAPTSGDPNTASPTSSDSPSQSGIPVPISGALSNGSSSHAGAIAGGVIGGVALILLILLGLLFFLRLRRRKNRARNSASGPGGGAVGGTGKWNGLSSRDSNLQSVLPSFVAKDRKVPSGIRRQSAGLSSTGHENGAEPTSPVGSDEDLSTLAEEEKIAHANALGNAYFNTSAPLPYTGQHHRRSSTGSNLNSPISQLSPAASTRSTNRAAALAKLDSSSSSPPKSPYNRRSSLDGRVLSNTSAPPSALQTPTTPTMAPAEMIPMNVNRASSGPRRATRKPVPTYSTPDGDVSVAMERERSTSSGGHAHAQAPALESATTLGSAGWKASQEDVHSVILSHKSSFGDNRPVHYLIPDMPPPQKD